MDRDYYALDRKDIRGNLEKAFEVAEKVGIPRLLDVDDIADFPVRFLFLRRSMTETVMRTQDPDAFSVMTYLSQFYHAFGHMMRPYVVLSVRIVLCVNLLISRASHAQPTPAKEEESAAEFAHVKLKVIYY